MQIARIIGTVVATRKEPSLNGLRFMLARPLDETGRETGSTLVAVDAVGAGMDEVVLIASGSSARQTVQTDKRPVDAVIMAIVDSWDVNGDEKYRKHSSPLVPEE
jgi:microcompartment protein CcmK/EutM